MDKHECFIFSKEFIDGLNNVKEKTIINFNHKKE